MRLIDADELLEHIYRDALDTREKIADMINQMPTIIPEIGKNDLIPNLITIAVKEPGHSWFIMDNIPNSLKFFQNIVGGPIEQFYIDPSGIIYFCNEEGKILDLPPNFIFGRDIIVGNVFAVRSNTEGEFINLTSKDVKRFEEMGTRTNI